MKKKKKTKKELKDKIIVVRNNQKIPDYLIAENKTIENNIKKIMALRIGEELLRKGLLNIEKKHNPKSETVIFKATLYCLKNKPK